MSNITFGKAIEYKVASEMMREDFDVYLPIADDHGVDLIAKTPMENIVEVQVKARTQGTKTGLFANIRHTPRKNYYFVFYLEYYNKTWILSSAEFIKLASKSINGKHVGTYTIDVLKKACAPFCVKNYSSII